MCHMGCCNAETFSSELNLTITNQRNTSGMYEVSKDIFYTN